VRDQRLERRGVRVALGAHAGREAERLKVTNERT
jgi:hypothetical protein